MADIDGYTFAELTSMVTRMGLDLENLTPEEIEYAIYNPQGMAAGLIALTPEAQYVPYVAPTPTPAPTPSPMPAPPSEVVPTVPTTTTAPGTTEAQRVAALEQGLTNLQPEEAMALPSAETIATVGLAGLEARS